MTSRDTPTKTSPWEPLKIDESRLANVHMSWPECPRLVEGRQNLVVRLSAPELSDIDFEPEKVHVDPRDVDLS